MNIPAAVERGAEDLQTLARLNEREFYASEPNEIYARLRREAPVFWFEEGASWGISKYEDVKFVHSHPELFSSMYGLLPSQAMVFDDGLPASLPGMPRRAELRQRQMLATTGAGNEFLLASDPPRHTRLRRLLSAAFTPRMIASLESGIRKLTREALDGIEPGAVVDIVPTIAAPIPLKVIAQMLGVPPEEWERFRRWCDVIAPGNMMLDPNSPEAAPIFEQIVDFATYFGNELAIRRSEPRDDLLSALQREIDGDVLSETDQLAMTVLLLLAGNETTQAFIAGGISLLAQHPDQRAHLVNDPTTMPGAIEEILRCVTPVVVFARTAMETTTIRGQQIHRGDYVMSLFASANRDEDVWSDPEVFDVLRRPDPAHIAFGFGPHFCMGAALARLEATIILEELLGRFPSFELAGDCRRYPASEPSPAYRTVPIAFERKKANDGG